MSQNVKIGTHSFLLIFFYMVQADKKADMSLRPRGQFGGWEEFGKGERFELKPDKETPKVTTALPTVTKFKRLVEALSEGPSVHKKRRHALRCGRTSGRLQKAVEAYLMDHTAPVYVRRVTECDHTKVAGLTQRMFAAFGHCANIPVFRFDLDGMEMENWMMVGAAGVR